MTDRDRLIELFEAVEKDPAITCPHYKTDKTCDTCKYTINNVMCNHTLRTVDYLLANDVIVQKQGKWVSAPIKDKGYDSKTIPTCTNCGYQSFITYTYCPDCGTKLKERV